MAKVYRLKEVFSDPQVLHRQMVIEFEHPKAGKVRQIGIAIKLSDTPGSVRRPSPLLGEDTDEILLNLGYAPEETKRLRKSGIIC